MRERESSSREERTPTVNTTLKAVVPPWNRIGCRERTQKQTKKVATRFRTSVECRTRKSPHHHQRNDPQRGSPLNEDNAAKRRVSPPALMSVGGGGGGRSKQPENGTVLFPFDSRFSHDFDCWQSEWMRRRRGRGTWLSQHTHTGRQGWARSARKVNEEGFFLLQKKSLEKDLG